MKITITIDATEEEARRATDKIREALGQFGDEDRPRVYQPTGKTSTLDEEEAIDLRTGRRGVLSGPFGFMKNAYIDKRGNVEFEHPQDNPLWACDFRT